MTTRIGETREGEAPAEPHVHAAEARREPRPPSDGSDAGPAPWQFSLRTLLIVVTVVSVFLAIGVHFGGIAVALVVIGLSQASILLSADWLIRPAHRRALAFVAAASWALVGSSFVIGAIVAIDEMLDTNTGSVMSWSFVISLCGAGALSYYIAKRRWRQLNARRDTGC